MIQSVERALTLLTTIVRHPDGIGVRQLSRENNLNPSTTMGLIKTLANMGFVQSDPQSKRYKLGIAIHALSQHVDGDNLVQQECQRVVDELEAKHEEQAFAACLSGKDMLVLARKSPMNRLSVRHGDRIIDNPHRLASGQILLAHQDDEYLTDYLNQASLENPDSNLPQDKDSMRSHLKVVKANEIAITKNVDKQGIGAISVPVYDHDHVCRLAISCSAPLNRFNTTTQKAMRASLDEYSKHLSQRIFSYAG